MIEERNRVGRVRGGSNNLGEIIFRNTRDDLGEAETSVVDKIMQDL